MENIRDWCIPRLALVGSSHSAWHCADCGHTTVSRTTPDKCEKCGSDHIAQDEDVLDTWFSAPCGPSAPWAGRSRPRRSSTGIPPTCLVTGYDIITYWVSKMIFSGLEYMGRNPSTRC